MALSLDDLNRPKKVKSKKNKSTDHNRPWENPAPAKKSEPITEDDNTDYLSFISSEDFPELKLVLNTAMNELQKKSYWLSRFTFKNSWLGRIKTQPKVQIPLPSFLTRKT